MGGCPLFSGWIQTTFGGNTLIVAGSAAQLGPFAAGVSGLRSFRAVASRAWFRGLRSRLSTSRRLSSFTRTSPSSSTKAFTSFLRGRDRLRGPLRETGRAQDFFLPGPQGGIGRPSGFPCGAPFNPPQQGVLQTHVSWLVCLQCLIPFGK